MADTGAGGIRAGRAYVEIGADDGPFNSAVNRVSAKMKSVGQTLSTIGGGLFSTGLTSAGLLSAPIKFAFDAAATARRFKAVFAEQSEAAKDFADSLANSLGRGKTDIYSALATYQALFKGLGFGGAQAAGLSKEIAQLAQDFSAFFNISQSETSDRFIAALSGSAEVLDQFGVNIRQAALDEEFLRQGIQATAQTASESQKTLARLSIIQRSLKSQGGVGFALANKAAPDNQFRSLVSQLKEIGATVGNLLIPAVQPYLALAGNVAKVTSEWAKAHPALVSGIAGAAAGMAILSVGAGAASLFIGKLVTTYGLIATAGPAVVASIGKIVSAFGALGAVTGTQIGTGIANFAATLTGTTAAIGSFIAANAVLIGAFVAVGAAVAALTYAYGQAQDELGKLETNATAYAAKVHDGNEANRDSVKRLAELSQGQRLAGDEFRTASKLIHDLQGEYGDLGITLDRTTGKVYGFADGLARLNKEASAREVRAIQAAIAEQKRNLEKLDADSRKVVGGNGMAADIGQGVAYTATLGIFANGSAKAQDLAEKSQKAYAEIVRLKGLLDTLEGRKPGGVNTPAPVVSVEDTVKVEADANKALADIYRDRQRARQTAAQNELAEFDAQTQAARQAIAERLRIASEQRDGAAIFNIRNESTQFERQSAEDRLRIIQSEERRKRDEIAETARARRQAARDRADFRSSLDRREAESRNDPEAIRRIDAEEFRRNNLARLRELDLPDEERQRLIDQINRIADTIASGADQLKEKIARIEFASIESAAAGQNRASRAIASVNGTAANAAAQTATNTAKTARLLEKLNAKLAVENGV